ncbi:MAG: caspase family protein [Chlamydiia bacterium]|nr:caspase family protein [Chlamydiia bacterium]
MKRFIFIALMCFPLAVWGATIHAIIGADTNASDIGESVFVDEMQISDELHNIASHTGLTLKLTILDGDRCSPYTLFSELKKLDIKSDDVVLFYWSGHGFRTYDKGNTNPWPNLYFTEYSKGVDLKGVFDKLKAKHPRLLIAMADTCNSFTSWGPSMVRKAPRPFVSPETVTRNYRELFLNTRRHIIASSSKPGEYSFGNNYDGGLFTSSFLSNFSREIHSNAIPNWDHVFSQSASHLNSQHPQWLIAPY